MFNFLKNNGEKYYKKIMKETKKDKELVYAINLKYENQEKKLLEIYGKCKKFEKNIKMIVIADTHGCLNEEEFVQFVNQHTQYDVCILVGDYSGEDINIILKYIDKEKIYAILGNHDRNYIEEYNLNNLNGNIIDVNGVKILGIQGSYKYKPENFPSFTQKESIEFLNDKEAVDILVSHDAPYGLNGKSNAAHQGLFGILYYIFKNNVPYCIHGHLHTPYEKYLINGTRVKCCYMFEFVEL